MKLHRSRMLLGVVLASAMVAGCTGGATPPEPAPAVDETPSGSGSPSPEATTEEAEQTGTRVRADFFGMHEGRVTVGVTPPVPVGALRFWDSGTSWLHLETSPGQFDWSGLDTAVASAEQADARPLLVLGQTPTFHASRPGQAAAYGPGAASMPELGAWRRYVEAVAARYGDRIDYQIWNETNIKSYWAGSPSQMAELTMVASRMIREEVPRATVVAPPFALRLKGQRRYFEAFWSQQSNGTDLADAVDAVAVHLYPEAEDPPEAQLRLLDDARAVLEGVGVDLPVWNTEINYGLLGGPEPPPIPVERQRAYLFRTYLLNAGAGIERVYWYRWDIGRIANTYLTEEDRSTVTVAGASFERLRTWLEGADFEGCAAADRVWRCEASRAGKDLQFVWHTGGGVADISVTRGTTWSRVDGSSGSCSRRTCTLEVGETPTMLVAGRRLRW